MRDDFQATESKEAQLPVVFQSFLAKFGEAGAKLGMTAPNIPKDESAIHFWEREN